MRKLAEIEQVLVASPDYLHRVGPVMGPGDLVRLDYIQYKSDPDKTHLAFADGSLAPITLSFAAQVPDLMLQAVQNHLGIATLPRFFVAQHLATFKILPRNQSLRQDHGDGRRHLRLKDRWVDDAASRRSGLPRLLAIQPAIRAFAGCNRLQRHRVARACGQASNGQSRAGPPDH